MKARQVRAQYTQELKVEAVRQVRSGQAIAVVAKVLGIPTASLGKWVRSAAKGELSGAGADDLLSPLTDQFVGADGAAFADARSACAPLAQPDRCTGRWPSIPTAQD